MHHICVDTIFLLNLWRWLNMTVSIRGGHGDQSSPPNPQNNSSNQGGTVQDSGQSGDSVALVNQDDISELLLPNGEVAFPLAELSKLDEMINRARWVVPVLPKGELEVLLEFSIRLCHAGMPCPKGPDLLIFYVTPHFVLLRDNLQRFLRNLLLIDGM